MESPVKNSGDTVDCAGTGMVVPGGDKTSVVNFSVRVMVGIS